MRFWYWILSWFDDRTFGAIRSAKWSKVRNDFIKKHPYCEVCGKKGTLLMPNNIHHIFPFHLKPMLELQESNLITLCPPHHLLFGHLMSWKSWEKDVRENAAIWRKKILERP